MSHARLSCSNHRWPKCAGSVREEAKYPDIPGEAAVDGTGSHLLLEMCIEKDVPAAAFLGQTIGVNHPDKPNGWTVYQDRVDRVQMCLDYLSRRIQELEKQFAGARVILQAETRANPGGLFGREDWWGTVDITITVLNPKGGLFFIEIVDYKDGQGWVNETDNTQLLSYCGGQMRPYVGSGPELVRPFRTERVGGCRMTIVQPKTNPVVRYQDTTAEHVLEKCSELNFAAHATDDPNAPLTPGDHCTWCKANPKRGGNCTAAIEKVMEMDTEMIPAYEFIQKAVSDPSSMDSDKLAELASARAPLMAAFDEIEKEITRRLEADEPVKGYALKPGRGSRVWNEPEEEIVKKLKSKRLKHDDIYPKKLASPAQILKSSSLSDTQKRKLEEELVTFKAGNLTLTKVAVEDRPTIDQMFGDLPGDKPVVAKPLTFI